MRDRPAVFCPVSSLSPDVSAPEQQHVTSPDERLDEDAHSTFFDSNFCNHDQRGFRCSALPRRTGHGTQQRPCIPPDLDISPASVYTVFRFMSSGNRTAVAPPTPPGPKGSNGNGCCRVSGSQKGATQLRPLSLTPPWLRQDNHLSAGPFHFLRTVVTDASPLSERRQHFPQAAKRKRAPPTPELSDILSPGRHSAPAIFSARQYRVPA